MAKIYGQLLPGVAGLTRSHTNYLFSAPADFTPDEGRSIFYYSHRSRPVLLVSNTSEAEYIVVLSFLRQPEESSLSHRELQGFLRDLSKKVFNIIAPVLGFEPLEPILSPAASPSHSFNVCYGPDLQRKPTTGCVEVVKLFKMLGLNHVLRLELWRQVTGQVKAEVRQPVEPKLQEALLAGTSLNSAPLGDIQRDDVQLLNLAMADEDSYQSLLDPVTNLTMVAQSEDVFSFAMQASVGNDVTLGQYLLLTHECVGVRFAATATKKDSSVFAALAHWHSEMQVGLSQLSCLLFQESLFPFGFHLLATCGLYAPTPDLTDPCSLDILEEQYYALDNQTRSLTKCGLPVTAGFYRTFSRTPSKFCVGSPLLQTGLLSVAAKDDIMLSRFMEEQYVVALGNFYPTTAVDKRPFLYCDSSDNINRIKATLRQFREKFPGPSVSSFKRAFGPAVIADQLFALVPQGGITFHLSSLPTHISSQLNRKPPLSPETLQAFVTSYYFHVISPQFFFVVSSKTVEIAGTKYLVINLLQKIAKSFGCSCKVVGITVSEPGIHIINDSLAPQQPITHPVPVSQALFTLLPSENSVNFAAEFHKSMWEQVGTEQLDNIEWNFYGASSTISKILSHPSVGSKEFIVRHIDRCSNGLIVQQQGVGPYDVPVADYTVVVDTSIFPDRRKSPNIVQKISPKTAKDLFYDISSWFLDSSVHYRSYGFKGHVIAIGEQPYKMVSHPGIGVKYGIAEVLTNMMFGPPVKPQSIQITASLAWSNQTAFIKSLETTMFASKEFCRQLGVSLSFTSGCKSSLEFLNSENVYDNNGVNTTVFTGKGRVSRGPRVTPELQHEGNLLVLVSIHSNLTLAGSVFEHSQTINIEWIPDIGADEVLKLFQLCQALVLKGLVVAGHDVSDGGVVACIAEMALAGNKGVDIQVPPASNPLAVLLSETPGAVVEVPPSLKTEMFDLCSHYKCPAVLLGRVQKEGPLQHLTISHNEQTLFKESLASVSNTWKSLAHDMFLKFANNLQDEELYRSDYGDNEMETEPLREDFLSKHLALFSSSTTVYVAVLHFPGCSVPTSILSALVNVGFHAKILTSQELISGMDLHKFSGLVVAGAAGTQDSYVGARGHISQLLLTHTAMSTLETFFLRSDTFSLGCGELGMQFLAACKVIGSLDKPGPFKKFFALDEATLDLERNKSHLYESLWLNFFIPRNTKSVFLAPLKGMVLPCWAVGSYLGIRYKADGLEYSLRERGLISLEFHGQSNVSVNHAVHYPRNPTGNSPVAGLCSEDGRHLGLLIDPSLAFHPWQWQWLPPEYQQMVTSPWSLMFQGMFLWSLKNKP